jgi:hypothetical protein
MAIKKGKQMNNNESNSIFFVTAEEQAKLHISAKQKKQTMTDDIINIFITAKMLNEHKNELTLDEITAAYYNMVTKQTPGAKLKTKKDIALKLFMMRGQKKNNGVIELVPGKRGTYRLKKSADA